MPPNTLSRLAFRQSRWILQRRAQSSTTEAAAQKVTEAKESVQQATSKASQGLSRVSSSAGNVLSSASNATANALSGVGGRTGRVIGFVQGQRASPYIHWRWLTSRSRPHTAHDLLRASRRRACQDHISRQKHAASVRTAASLIGPIDPTNPFQQHANRPELPPTSAKSRQQPVQRDVANDRCRRKRRGDRCEQPGNPGQPGAEYGLGDAGLGQHRRGGDDWFLLCRRDDWALQDRGLPGRTQPR